jgi:hypothetical protein
MSIKLSHSAASKYEQCPAMYKYHYIDKIRPIINSSALYFGSALDEAFNVLLESKMEISIQVDKEHTSLLQQAIQKFEDEWDDSYDSNNIEYFKSDIDLSLLDEPTIKDLKVFDPEVSDHDAFIKECFSILSNKNTLSEEDRKLYNMIAWNCLNVKGKMLIEAYHKDILPQIAKVFDIQKKVELPDDNGNVLIGYIDAVVSFIDAPDRKVVLDNKTSSKAYKQDSVANSPQLATYCEYEQTEWGAYAVVEKTIRKREPKTRTQLIIDKLPENTIDETFNSYNNVLEGITSSSFEKNYDSGCFFFGKPCSYYAYCRSNGENKKGLKNVSTRKA